MPPAHDAANRARLWAWLGDSGAASERIGEVLVETPSGWTSARPGDWIILTRGGSYQVAALTERAAEPPE